MGKNERKRRIIIVIKIKQILESNAKERKHYLEINENEFEKYLINFYKTNVDDILSLMPIYRGINSEMDFIYIQPSKHTRQSANTQNYYTLIIDNSKYWKDYPKRSKSIVCTGHIEEASQYGNVYRVFPKYNAKIAICSKHDIWDSFDEGLNILNNVFNTHINNLHFFNSFLEEHFNIMQEDAYKMIIQKINKFQLTSKQKHIIEKYNYNTLFEFIDYCLNPKLNGFQLVSFNENLKNNEKFKDIYSENFIELWTNADCIMVKEEE